MTNQIHRSDMVPEDRAKLMRQWFPFRVTLLTSCGRFLTMDAYRTRTKAIRIARDIVRLPDLNHNAIKCWVHNQVSGNLTATVKVPKLRC